MLSGLLMQEENQKDLSLKDCECQQLLRVFSMTQSGGFTIPSSERAATVAWYSYMGLHILAL